LKWPVSFLVGRNGSVGPLAAARPAAAVYPLAFYYTGSVGPDVIAMTSAPVGLVTVWTQPGGRRA
jgi:hypothetical protein